MPFGDRHFQQTALLIRMLPFVTQEKCFALKGGTAINLFIRNMPRLSVDIDLTYLPREPRQTALAAIDAALTRIANRVRTGIEGAQVTETKLDGLITKLLVRSRGVQTKVEVNLVIRGCVFDPEMRRVAPAVEDKLGFAETRLVSFADLYAGKLVAALDRQHPRDLFDVRDLLANEGIDYALRQCFIAYLLSHDRPMWEVLEPHRKNLSDEFMHGFDGMTDTAVSIDELVAARDALISDIVGNMPDEHRRFLVSFERGDPDWPLLEMAGVPELPAVKWRLHNLERATPEKRAVLVVALERTLFG
jgi:predicted nucleotidyltransferase component of viral defense system